MDQKLSPDEENQIALIASRLKQTKEKLEKLEFQNYKLKTIKSETIKNAHQFGAALLKLAQTIKEMKTICLAGQERTIMLTSR